MHSLTKMHIIISNAYFEQSCTFWMKLHIWTKCKFLPIMLILTKMFIYTKNACFDQICTFWLNFHSLTKAHIFTKMYISTKMYIFTKMKKCAYFAQNTHYYWKKCILLKMLILTKRAHFATNSCLTKNAHFDKDSLVYQKMYICSFPITTFCWKCSFQPKINIFNTLAHLQFPKKTF